MLRASFSLCLFLVALGCASASEGGSVPTSEASAGAGDCCPAIPSGGATGTGGDSSESDASAGTLAAPSGCSELLWREAAATAAATETLVATATELTQRVSVACGSLREELTRESGEATESNATVTELCAAAEQALRVVKDTTGATLPAVAVEGGQCSIAAASQIDCEKSCSDGCSPGSPSTRCDAESLYAICGGICAGGAACQGSIEAPALCLGECKGACQGTCDGDCTALVNSNTGGAFGAGNCDGLCDGNCDGTCTGECLLTPSSNVSCGSEAPCQGSCSEPAVVLDCVWPLGETESTECTLAATCYQACAGKVALTPNCVPPTVHVMGGFAASVVTALEAYLAPLFRAAGGDGRLAASAAPDLVAAAASVQLALDADPTCMAEVGVENIGALVEAPAARSAIDDAVAAASGVVVEALGEAQSKNIL